jgi:putative membrane protein
MIKTKVTLAGVLATTATVALAAAPASAQAATKAPSVQDIKFLQTSAAGDLFEIQGGKVALAKAQTATTRAYAQKLVTDHTKSLADTRTIAKALSITLPSQPLPPMRQALAEVGSHSGMSFDVAYLKEEVTDHFGDIAGAIKEVERGSNARIKGSAAMELPMLRSHLWRGALDVNYVLWLSRS